MVSVYRGHALRILSGALLLGATMFADTSADVDKTWDWPAGKRSLKICVSDLTLCPPNFVDSVKAAIDTWNMDLTSWTLTYTDTCASADIKVDCDNISGLGQWTADYNSTTKEATNHKIKVRITNDWGWCNDKYEVVSTLMHEMGHAMRLDHTHATDQMRAGQDKPGHLRGISTKDSTEAALSDGSNTKTTDTTPSGAKKNQIYSGTITPGSGDPPLNLLGATSVNLVPYRPSMVQVISTNVVGNDQLQWQAFVHPASDGTEPFLLVIEHPGPVFQQRWGYLHVVDSSWNTGWTPAAVAPPDTSVPGASSPVMLYAWSSSHGGGFDRMDFTWIIDDNALIKGETQTSVTLPVGSHLVQLVAVDEFGNESRDAMNVTVGAAGIPILSPGGLVALVLLLVVLSVVFLRRRAVIGAAAMWLRSIGVR